ncbi:MAG: hypothetical protein ABSD72_07115 [Terracidiphilus sp.]
MRGLKTLLGTTALLAGLAMAPAAQAQIVVGIGVQPVCSYGYYDYAPYACAPMGFYGPGYFYNGIFLGMGPWANWGYGHGWGGHRFGGAGGGSYRGGGGGGYRGAGYRGGGGGARGGGARGGGGHGGGGGAARGGGGGHAGGGGHGGGGGGHR